MLLLAFLLLAAKPADVEREFSKVEKRMYGADQDLRDACSPLEIRIEDLATEVDRSLEIRKSDVTLMGERASDLRACVRGVAKHGVIDSWTLAPDGDRFALKLRLVRARRDPNITGKRRRARDDREAAKALTKLWEERTPKGETLGPEVIAPDVIRLREARWVAGVVTIEGSAESELHVAAYEKLVEPLAADGPRVEFAIHASGEAGVPPAFPDSGLLRASLKDAPASAVLRAFAHLDRRDFVIPSADARKSGTIGGGWDGIVAKLAIDAEREPLRVGAIDVFAPKGTRPPKPTIYEGKRVTLELDGVTGQQLWTLLSAAAERSISGPDFAPLDVQLRNVPWPQAVRAIALAHGCEAVDGEVLAKALIVACPKNTPPAASNGRDVIRDATVEMLAPLTAQLTTADQLAFEQYVAPKPSLERYAAYELRVVVLAKRETSARWVAIVETPDGFRGVVRDGVVLGKEGARASVDDAGVSLLLERPGITVAVPLRF